MTCIEVEVPWVVVLRGPVPSLYIVRSLLFRTSLSEVLRDSPAPLHKVPDSIHTRSHLFLFLFFITAFHFHLIS